MTDRNPTWLVVALVACSSPATQPVRPTAPAGAEKRVVVTLGRPSGSYVETKQQDGAIQATLDILQNGRGPHVDATMRFDSDGTLASLAASGHHEMGNRSAESFKRAAGKATWEGTEEHGERSGTDHMFYVPLAEMPTTQYVIEAALKNGGTVPLLPAGESHVEKVGEMTVSAGGQTRKIIAYAATGLDFVPTYVWFDEDGSWFGTFSAWRSFVPEGWESVIEPIVAKQEELDRELDQKVYTANAQKPPAAGLAFTHARVLDPDKGAYTDDQTVVITGDTISAVGPTAKTAVPAGAKVIDLGGKSLLPGMIDMHSHTDKVGAVLDIASGVTTARDVGNDPDQLDEWKHSFDTGAAVGPRIVRMGFIEGRNEKAAASKVTAETPDEAKAAVELFAKRGYEGIKIYNSMKTDLVPILTKAAHDKGMLVTGHIPVHMLANEAVKAGYDGIEHINMLFLNFFATHDTDTRTPLRFTLVGDKATSLDLASKPVQDFLALLREHKTVIDPTLIAFQDLYLGQAGQVVPGWDVFVSRLPAQVRRVFLINGLPMEGDKRELYRQAWTKLLAMVKALYDAKVPVVLGTDSIGGLAFHREMQLFRDAGIPNAAILKMATIDAARAMRLDGKIGSIAPGKQADMIVVAGDPLADITEITHVTQTVSRGVLFGATPLYQAVGVMPAPGPIMGNGASR
ncbi:MAG TPA: amidohydrolase family protein [Kofleriaceae bacterium]|nr:amidohydrolase family protein [Kofleriaceae bacterium]